MMTPPSLQCKGGGGRDAKRAGDAGVVRWSGIVKQVVVHPPPPCVLRKGSFLVPRDLCAIPVIPTKVGIQRGWGAGYKAEIPI